MQNAEREWHRCYSFYIYIDETDKLAFGTRHIQELRVHVYLVGTRAHHDCQNIGLGDLSLINVIRWEAQIQPSDREVRIQRSRVHGSISCQPGLTNRSSLKSAKNNNSCILVL